MAIFPGTDQSVAMVARQGERVLQKSLARVLARLATESGSSHVVLTAEQLNKSYRKPLNIPKEEA